MEEGIYILIIVILCPIAAWLWHGRLTKEIEAEFARHPKILPPDGKKPVSLTTVNFIGVTMFGDFRHYDIDGEDSYVSYYCFAVIIPLIPLNCYRVVQKGGNRYYFISSDEMRGKEVICVYLNALKWVLSIAAVIYLLVNV